MWGDKVFILALVAVTCNSQATVVSITGGAGATGFMECLPGWEKLEGKCFRLLNSSVTYAGSLSSCGSLDPQHFSRAYILPRATPLITLAKLQSFTSKFPYLKKTWAGFTRSGGEVQYANGTTHVDASKLPSLAAEGQNCGVMSTTTTASFTVRYASCLQHLPAICVADVAVKLCDAAAVAMCRSTSGNNSECQEAGDAITCACKQGYFQTPGSLCVADTFAHFNSDTKKCIDYTSYRETLVFNHLGFANTLLPYSNASAECARHGATLLTHEQTQLLCVQDFRINVEQYIDQSTYATPSMLPRIWIQYRQDKCTSTRYGELNTLSCRKPQNFLCVKPITSTYWCEATGKLLVRINNPIGINGARSMCSSVNFQTQPASSSLLSTSTLNTFPEMMPCLAAAASLIQVSTDIVDYNANIVVDGGPSQHCQTYNVKTSKLSPSCNFSTSHTFCVRDAPRTFVDKSTATELFHPIGNPIHNKAALDHATSLCKQAGADLAQYTQTSSFIRGFQQLSDYVPGISTSLSDVGVILWHSGSTTTATCNSVSLATPAMIDTDQCENFHSFLCSKRLSNTTEVTCQSYIYFHPDQDLLNTRVTYAVANSACNKAGAFLPEQSLINSSAADAGCLQRAASSEHGLQNPISFAKPSRTTLNLWLQGPRGVTQNIFSSGSKSIQVQARNSGHHFLCAKNNPMVTAPTTMPTASSTPPTCDAGSERLVGNTNCTEIDECESQPCGQSTHCVDAVGSYTCQCVQGFVNQTTNATHPNCTNTNECLTTKQCGTDETCQDTPGSYKCSCNTGYSGSAGSCKDINECTPTKGGVTPCNTTSALRVCENTKGGYKCKCSLGYVDNGQSCVNKNECKQKPCDVNSECSDTEGSYACICKSGYVLENLNCVNVNECAGPVCSSNAQCADTQGSYTCTCLPGYSSNGDTCANINECNTTITSAPAATQDVPCNNTALCVDTDGSYACPCTQNYTGELLCPATKRSVDKVVQANKAPSTFSNPLVMTGIAVGAVVVIVLVLVVIRVCRSSSSTEVQNPGRLPGQSVVHRSREEAV